MQNFKNLYIELGEKINTDVPEVKWIDLWHNQITFLEDEYAFPTPAIFFSFRSNELEDTGIKVQSINMQIDVYLYYETLADTHRGSLNQQSAFAFLEILDKTFKSLHGSSGVNFNNMRRLSFGTVDTGGAGNLYRSTYEAVVQDYGVDAHNTATQDLTPNGLIVTEGQAPASNDPPLFNVPG